KRKNLPIESAARPEPVQGRKQSQVQDRFVNFGRMDSDAVCFMIQRKMDRPWKACRPSITTPIHETSPTANGVAKGNTWREDVAELPDRQFFNQEKDQRRERCPNQAAVEDKPTVLDHKDFPNRPAREIFVPV